MAIFLVSSVGLACTFYVYVLIKFMQDETHIRRELSEGSKPIVRQKDCTSH
jgi:hypothetical protein